MDNRIPGYSADPEAMFEDLLKASRTAKQEDLELADAMSRLINNKDFQLYLSRVINNRIQLWGDMLMVPAGGHDGLVRSEYAKGTLCGLCLARDLPSVIIAAMSEIRNSNSEER